MTYQFRGYIPTAGIAIGDIVFSGNSRHAPSRLTVKRIQDTVADFYDLDPEVMTSANKKRDWAHARQVAMYFARKILARSYPEIGRMFGGKDHTTVLYGIRSMTKRMETDEFLRAELSLIKLRLTA
jgi:chromosomal replication initiator protein